MSIIKLLMEFLYPPRCPACQAYVEHTGAWCESCLAKTLAVHRIAQAVGSPLTTVWTLSRYHGVMRSLILNLKYHDKKSNLSGIKNYIEIAAQRIKFPTMPQMAVFVPLHKKRMKERGFNQTELIFKNWCKANNIPIVDCLERVHFTERQACLKRQERFMNVHNAFLFRKKFSVKGKVIILFDDIYTTGATINTCAHILHKAGAKDVYGLVLASDA